MRISQGSWSESVNAATAEKVVWLSCNAVTARRGGRLFSCTHDQTRKLPMMVRLVWLIGALAIGWIVPAYGAKHVRDSRTSEGQIKRLLEQLKSADPWERGKAVHALLSKGSQVVPRLIRELGNPNCDVRGGVTQVLGQIGQPAVPFLLDALKSKNSAVRAEALQSLGVIADSRVVPAALKALSDTDPQVRVEAAKALGKSGQQRVVTPLLNASKDKEAQVRVAVSSALGWLGEPKAVPTLIQLLKSDEDFQVRAVSAFALGEIGDTRAIKPLISVLRDKTLNRRWKASPTDIQPGPMVRGAAALALGMLKAIEVVPTLREIADNQGEDPYLRQMAKTALDMIRPRGLGMTMGLF